MRTDRPAIIVPYAPLSIVADGAGAANLRTPDPMEIHRAAGATALITLDLGAARQIDTVFVGFTNGGAGTSLKITAGITSATDTVIVNNHPAAQSWVDVDRRHLLWTAPAPIAARHVALTVSPSRAGGFETGVVAVGRAWQPEHPQEWGAGRTIGDTGARTRLSSGSFGIDEGVSTVAWQWTFGDLSDREVDELQAIARSRRQTRSLLVIERPDQAIGLQERLHWGMFDRLEAFERRDVGKTRWAFRIEDWA